MTKVSTRMFPRNWKPSLYRRIVWKLEAFWTLLWYDIPSFFSNLWKWRSVLWRDRDFDYVFMLEVLKFKMSNMRKHMLEHNIAMRTPMMAKQLLYGEFLIDRILKDDYCKEEQAAHQAFWGETKYDSIELEEKLYDGSKLYQLDIYSEFARELGQEEQERQEQLAIYHKQGQVKAKDWERLGRHIAKYAANWWD